MMEIDDGDTEKQSMYNYSWYKVSPLQISFKSVQPVEREEVTNTRIYNISVSVILVPLSTVQGELWVSVDTPAV